MRARNIEVTPELLARLLDDTVVDGVSGCWEWQRCVTARGYGYLKHKQRGMFTHRVGWCWWNKQVNTPDEQPDIDHVCRNKRCWNPQHLEAVSHRENICRGELPAIMSEEREDRENPGARWARSKTHCKRGHEFNEENTYWTPSRHRACRPCFLQRNKEYYQQRKEAKIASQNHDTAA